MTNALISGKLYIKTFKGALPANLNGTTLTSIVTTRAADKLCEYGYITLDKEAVDQSNLGWFMLTTAAAINAVGTGAATWFIASFMATTGSIYDYFVCDSISLPGGTGVLQLNSLSYVAGALAPTITDFAIKL
jgi:hypothetical protein